MDDRVSKYLRTGQRMGWWRKGNAYNYYCRHQLFRNMDLHDKSILDVGCGNGKYGLWAVAAGAGSYVGLDPAGAGSRGAQMIEEGRTVAREMNFENARFVSNSLEEFEPGEEQWDIVLLHNSINHLHEPACVTLHKDKTSWDIYRRLVERIYAMTARDGVVVVTDCSRDNFFGNRGRRNPFAPTIEWEKHQAPELWAELLQQSGYVNPDISWPAPPRLFHVGVVLSVSAVAFFTSSMFRLTACKV